MSTSSKKNIEIVNFLSPNNICFYINDGDTIYAEADTNVYQGDLIRSNNNVLTFSPVSGKLLIKKGLILIKNDLKELKDEGSKPLTSILKLKKDDILKKLNKFQIKILNDLENKELVINILPYLKNINSDYLILQNEYRNILDTIELLRREFNTKATILIPKNNKEITNLIKNNNGTYLNIKYKYLKDKFPFTNDYLIKNKYFHNKNIISIHIFKIYEIYNILKNNRVLDYKYLNISFIDKDYIVKVKNGTTLVELLKKLIGKNYLEYTYYLDNELNREVIDNIKCLTVDDIESLYVSDIKHLESYPCIKCGKCIRMCPLGLNPREKLDEKCIKCGICNYVCPSNINLVSKGDINE